MVRESEMARKGKTRGFDTAVAGAAEGDEFEAERLLHTF